MKRLLFFSVLPLVLGCIVYFYNNYLGSSITVRNYVPDILWAISLSSSIFFVTKNRRVGVSLAIFCIFISESCQILNIIPGVFDWFDILFMTIFSILTFSIFYKINYKTIFRNQLIVIPILIFFIGISLGSTSLNNSSSSYSYYDDSEDIQVCAKYQKEYGYSKGYSVNAKLMTGSLLNKKTSSFRFKTYNKYVVIFWDPNEATIIELPIYISSISSIPVYGVDQKGTKWQVSTNSFCY